jgi:hypothetical protein
MGMPLHFFRFEDVLVKPKEVLEDIFSFMLEVDDVEGRII